MLKKSKGITLIALVVTIIVLLILAGVTLSFVAGENGILKRATDAVDINEKATAEEEANLLLAELGMQYYEEKYVEHKEVEETIDAYLTKQLETGRSTGTGEYTVKIENGQVIVSKGNREISRGTLNNGKVLEWSGSSNQPSKPNIENNDWKKVLDLAGVDSSKFSTYEDALEDETVRNTIISNQEAVDCLLNSTEDIINATINNEKMLENLATNEETAKKIISDEKWYGKLENNTVFFDHINITSSETLNFVEDENPYYTFKAKANKTYFIQCYGAQGGSYINHGGYGGYSYGIFKTTRDTDLYIYKGGQGIGGVPNNPISGGYNGGGAVLSSWGDGNEKRSSGGGATHVALVPGLLSSLENNQSDIIMIAGGGGGSGGNSAVFGSTNGFGGNGGGTQGADGVSTRDVPGAGGTQTTPGLNASFGKGGDGTHGLNNGGGAGLYGGGVGWLAAGGRFRVY